MDICQNQYAWDIECTNWGWIKHGQMINTCFVNAVTDRTCCPKAHGSNYLCTVGQWRYLLITGTVYDLDQMCW